MSDVQTSTTEVMLPVSSQYWRRGFRASPPLTACIYNGSTFTAGPTGTILVGLIYKWSNSQMCFITFPH
jgi:hypothetical protein